MSSVLIFDDSTSACVFGRALDYLSSVNTPDYLDRTDALINPDVSALGGVPQQYWKRRGDTVIEMTASDKTSLNDYLSAKTKRAMNFRLKTYSPTFLLLSDMWYDGTDSTGGYTGKAEGSEYLYSGANLVSRTDFVYNRDGSIQSTAVHSFFMNDKGQMIEKTQEI